MIECENNQNMLENTGFYFSGIKKWVIIVTIVINNTLHDDKIFDITMLRVCLICGEIFNTNNKLECCGMSMSLPINHVKDVKSFESLKERYFITPVIKEIKVVIKEKKYSSHKIDKKIRQQVLKRDKNKCTECNCKTELHIHHILHRKDGGTDSLDNLATLCDLCHAEKHRGEPVYNIMIKSLFKFA